MIIDFAGRFQAAFGFITGNVAARLIENGFGEVVKDDNVFDMAVYTMDDNSFFDDIMLEHDTAGEFLFGFRSLNEENADVFATPPMLSMKRAKKLIITAIDNSDTEVIERYGTEPWEITWRGLLIDMENHNFPLDKLEKMNEIFEVNDIWKVHSAILNKVSVNSIYIQNISFEFVDGYEDTISYTLTTRAVKPVEFQLTN